MGRVYRPHTVRALAVPAVDGARWWLILVDQINLRASRRPPTQQLIQQRVPVNRTLHDRHLLPVEPASCIIVRTAEALVGPSRVTGVPILEACRTSLLSGTIPR